MTRLAYNKGSGFLLAVTASVSLSGGASAVERLVASQIVAAPSMEASVAAEGVRVTPSESGARLRCVFQRLEGEATRDGLWLRSTVSGTGTDRFRVVARSVKRVPAHAPSGGVTSADMMLDQPLHVSRFTHYASRITLTTLPATGNVSIEGPAARFTRPGLIEEYSVSMDGVRQDFVVAVRPEGTGALRVQLEVTGAQVQPAADGAQLVLPNSGRKIAYSRLRVTDAAGKELPARIQVATPHKSEIRKQKAEIVNVLVNDAGAVYPVRIDPTFSDANWISMGGLPGANGPVYAAVLDGSGNLYIGGSFTVVGDVIANGIAKWNGSSWSALGLGMDGWVRALAVSGSNVYAGGSFTTAGDIAATNIAKWNGGSWSPLGEGINGGVHALAVSGGGLYAGGYFMMAGGSTANSIAKWNGNSWSALGGGIRGDVYALAVSGSDVYVGGLFTTAGGSAATNIAKWNGSSWSALAEGIVRDGWYGSAAVSAVAVSGSDLYAGGNFSMGGDFNYGIAKWNGSSWSALGSGIGGAVYALAVSGSNVYTGGQFTITTGGESPANYIAKWDGSSWSALGSGIGGGGWNSAQAGVSALAVSSSGVYAGGNFTAAGGSPANYIAKWDRSSWSPLSEGIGGLHNTRVNGLAVSDSDIYVGGLFTTAGGSPANSIAKWNGNSWSALDSGMDGEVYALAVSGSDLYAGGSFTTAGGVVATNIAKWNGSSWSPLGEGINGGVYALAVSGGDVYAAGGLSIAKWNGTNWSALGEGIGGFPLVTSVSALALSGTDLYVGGSFTTAGGVVANNIAKWNGSSWNALGSGLDGHVSALAVIGNDLYAGGMFTTAGGRVSAYVARAYLERPALAILRSGADVIVSWPSFYSTFVLEQNSDVANSNNWSPANYPLTTNGAIKSATLPLTTTNQLFRLVQAQ